MSGNKKARKLRISIPGKGTQQNGKLARGRKAEKCPKRFSGHLRSPSLFRFAPLGSYAAVRWSGGAMRRHLYKTSARRIVKGCYIFLIS